MPIGITAEVGLSAWCTDQAGPFQDAPYAGRSWQPEGQPACQPHKYLCNGTAKILTRFHPADGPVRLSGVTSCTNPVLHGWLKQEVSQILAALPKTWPDMGAGPQVLRCGWERWQTDTKAGGQTLETDLCRCTTQLTH